jgi:hypothetical protein
MSYNSPASNISTPVVETLHFMRQADLAWTEAEREEFVDYIARNPEAGDAILETG